MDVLQQVPVDDAELERQALDADPDVVCADAVPFASLFAAGADSSLPSWYMPTPMPRRRLRGWRRNAILLVVASFLAIDAYGLCNTYGDLTPQTVHARTHLSR